MRPHTERRIADVHVQNARNTHHQRHSALPPHTVQGTSTAQAAKELTFTNERMFTDVFRVRAEYRHDFPIAQVFNSRRSQGTLLIGMVVNF
jgi:hypothetical protein